MAGTSRAVATFAASVAAMQRRASRSWRAATAALGGVRHHTRSGTMRPIMMRDRCHLMRLIPAWQFSRASESNCLQGADKLCHNGCLLRWGGEAPYIFWDHEADYVA